MWFTLPRSRRRTLVWQVIGFVWLGAVLASVAAESPSPARRPHLLVIMVDDLGWGDLGCYGAPDLRTPHLDRLAAEGLRFTRFRANSSVCSPTRAALLTGRYPDQVGVPGVIRTDPANTWGYLSAAPTVAEHLREAGYATALVGKWHLGLSSPNTPNERGFAEFHGFLGDMMDDVWHHRRHGQNYLRRNAEVIAPEGHVTDLFTGWAQAFLESRAAAGPEAAPFFLFLSYTAPHDPIQPPPEWVARVEARESGITPARAKLAAFIEQLDDGVGRVLATLQERGLADDTLVIFTSDNGGRTDLGARNGPHRGAKGSMYEGGLAVAALARWPGRIAPGTTTDALALTMDLAPTLLEVAGLPPSADLDGVSLSPLLHGRPQPGLERPVYFVRREGGLPFGGKTIEAVRVGDWKLLQNSPFEPLQLFNLAEDPMEERNLAGSEPARMRELGAVLRRFIQRGGALPWQPALP